MSTQQLSPRSILSDYFAIYERLLRDDLSTAASLPWHGLNHFAIKRASERTVLCPFHGVSLSPFEYRMVQFTQEITDFWQRYGEPLFGYTKSLRGMRIQFPYAEFAGTLLRDIKRLAAYFDTVVVMDVFVPWADDVDLRTSYWRQVVIVDNFRRAVWLYGLKNLALADFDPPLVLIVPSNNQPNQDQVEDYALSFIDRIFPDRFKDRGTTIDAARSISEPEAIELMSQASKNNLYKETLSDFDVTPLSRVSTDTHGNAQRWRGCLKDLPPLPQLQGFMNDVFMSFNTYCEYQTEAAMLGNDVVVGKRRWQLHKWHLERTARVNFSASSLADEELVSQAILHPSIDFLGDITLQELLGLRKTQGLEEIRASMRIDHGRIKTIPVEDFSKEAKTTAAHFLEALSDFENELQRTLQEQKGRQWWTSLSLGLGITLGIASVAVPGLAISAAAVGVLVGTESIRSVINHHLTGRKRRKELLARPFGLLYHVHERARQTSTPQS